MKRFLLLFSTFVISLLTSCHGTTKVSKNNFLSKFLETERETPVYRKITGTVKAGEDRYNCLDIAYESSKKKLDEARVCDYYDYVLNNGMHFIEDAISYYCDKGFKIVNRTNVIVWDEHKNITLVNITDNEHFVRATTIDLVVSNHY